MIGLLKNTRSIKALKESLGFGGVFAATKFDFGVEYTAKVDFKKVLILSPHPDDAFFAMGGTIKKMTTAGSVVQMAVFTDGSSAALKEGQSLQDLISQKKLEAQRAGEILGVKDLYFWGYRDGQLAAGHSAMKALHDLIEQAEPDIIFLPSFLDYHPDHRAANEIFLNTVAGLPEANRTFEVWAYELWTPILINRMVDVTLYIKTKEEAMRVYEAETQAGRQDKTAVALNQYRAESNGISGFGESFFASNLALYKELYEKS